MESKLSYKRLLVTHLINGYTDIIIAADSVYETRENMAKENFRWYKFIVTPVSVYLNFHFHGSAGSQNYYTYIIFIVGWPELSVYAE